MCARAALSESAEIALMDHTCVGDLQGGFQNQARGFQGQGVPKPTNHGGEVRGGPHFEEVWGEPSPCNTLPSK